MSIAVMILMIIYPIGFLLTLTFFKFFGKRINDIDYDSIKPEDRWPDDWESNNDFYIGMSTFWFMTMPMWLIAGIVMVIYKFSKWYLNFKL
jgi:hypothetical protein